MKKTFNTLAVLMGIAIGSLAQKKTNVVLIFPDNLGIGEVSSYGGVRGVPTPNIDQIGKEGIRLTNFNVEFSCIPSRAAILTGRYAPRTAETYAGGLTLWEVTIAEGLRSQGYATGLYGKWDAGGPNWEGKREPTHQGFDEWYGIPLSSHVSQYTSFEGFDQNSQPIPYVWQGTAGSPSQKVKPFNLQARRTIDREAAERAIRFMENNSKKEKPFFVYYPMTQLHFPSLPHPDKAGATGAGDMGDAMADVDHNVGLILNALKRLKIENNTLVIWCTDNGAEMRRPWRGSAGPWRGYYNSAMEGGVRTPCVMRWPGKIKPGQVSNEIVHEVDLFATIAAAVGAPGIIPTDRNMDGVNQLAFLQGNQGNSNRESAIYMNGNGQAMAVKWHDWKLWYYFKTEMPDPNPDNLVRLFNLRVDPTEETDVKDSYPWVISIMDGIVDKYEKSLIQYPRVTNQTDPYLPPPSGSGKPVEIYSRTDRVALRNRSSALPNPDFSGSWSTTVLDARNPVNLLPQSPTPTLGSGWGDKISIKHKSDILEIERVMFVPRELQGLVHYRYALNGSETENLIYAGLNDKAPVSTCAWEENRLVITTFFPYQEPKTGQWLKYKMVQTLWLSATTDPPFEPVLVVETYREAAAGGMASTTRTVYTRGYR
jgi:arylsulfatase A-like enzyme